MAAVAVTTIVVDQITIVVMETIGMTQGEEITIAVALTITAGTLTREKAMNAEVQATLREATSREEGILIVTVIMTDEVIDETRMRGMAESQSQRFVKKTDLEKAPSRQEQNQLMTRSMETRSMR